MKGLVGSKILSEKRVVNRNLDFGVAVLKQPEQLGEQIVN